MSGEQAAFGALLRELRLSASQTIEGLAEASGVHGASGISSGDGGRLRSGGPSPRSRTDWAWTRHCGSGC
ncbi:hypothetical protein [Streptomyces geranii]|uniref:hypothetical protein n=1 Tax=Streptomyces geranii TaxID=2058923 RepID=UPI001E300E2E|nr:hypothetical protein [Streptomyces geranii]